VQSTQEGVLVLGRLRSTERAVRTKVGAIAPPAKAAGAHRRLLGALDRLDAQVQRLMVVARKGQLAPFVTAAQRFGSSSVFAQLGRALDAIEAAGYPLHLSS
jgi:hypothetical protein